MLFFLNYKWRLWCFNEEQQRENSGCSGKDFRNVFLNMRIYTRYSKQTFCERYSTGSKKIKKYHSFIETVKTVSWFLSFSPGLLPSSVKTKSVSCLLCFNQGQIVCLSSLSELIITKNLMIPRRPISWIATAIWSAASIHYQTLIMRIQVITVSNRLLITWS